ncbi:MAG: ABC transporter substrate-binding protein [Oscillospiraceae bacterium]|nr:ABC transporter substrate-binding protein [Oscillospiraceae bacterium]MDD3261560.1 ABC transporter substrate-binding protein [Oscillospiraceae bacterium]
MKKSGKRILSFTMAAVMAVGCLAGCSSEDSSTASGGTSGKSTGITLTFGSHQSGLPTSGIVQKLAAEFEKESGIKIDFQISPDAQWRDLLKVKEQSGEVPDIFCADTTNSLESAINPEKYCADLSDQSWVSRIDKDVLPSVSLKNKVYGITFPGKKMYFYIYNKEIFKKCGIANVPTTYQELKDACAKIKTKMPDVTPIYEATTDGWHQVLPVAENSGVYLKEDANLFTELNANKKKLTDIPQMKTILNQMKECASLGYFGKDYMSNATADAKEAMAKGKAAMYIAEAAFRDEIKADYPNCKTNFGIFVQPWGDNQVIGVNPASNAYFISKDSKNADAAKKFFDFLARPENLKKRLAGQPGISEVCWPEIKGKYTDEDQKYIKSHKTAKVLQIGANYVDVQFMDIGKDIESMYTGAMTPDDVIKSAEKRRQQQAQLQKDPAFTS